MRPTVSVIIPALDEAERLPALVGRLRGEVDEVVVADGGSRDRTVALSSQAGARVVTAPRGRGPQQNAGARAATGRILWFLHADCQVPDGAVALLRATDPLASPWGCFGVKIRSDDPRLRWCGRVMEARARLTGSATGDMGLWAHRSFWAEIGGFPEVPILEDLSFTDRARRRVPPTILPLRLGASARRWETRGVNRTILEMWAIRAAFRLGVAPGDLARWYPPAPAPSPPPPGEVPAKR